MEGNNNKKKKSSSFITKANNFLDNYGGYIAAGICGITLAVGYYVKGYTYDVKCDKDEELENEFPNVMNLWRANSFWAKMKKSKFEEVMKTPIELYVTREVIPKLYHNSVTQNVKVYLSKSGFLEQDKSIVGQVLNELSKSSSIEIDPPQSLTNRFFKLFVPNQDGFITKEEFVKKFYLLTKAKSNQREILQIIFDMLDVGQNKYLTFNSFFEIFNEFAVLFSEFTPRLLKQIRIQIRDIIIEKIYDRFDQYIPLNDIPEEKFTIITSEFSHKNSLSIDITSILIPESFEKIQEIFKDQSRFKNINNLKQRVLDIQEFRNCMNKIFNYPLIAEKIISFTLGNLSEEDSLFTIDKQDFETYKDDCIEEIKNNADQISDFLWEIINSNGDEYLTENEFDTFFSFLYSLHEVVEEKIEDENPLSTLTKSYKGIFLAKESGSDLSNAHRLTRLLKYRNEKDISGKKLNNFINSLLSFFSSFLDTLVKSMTTKSSVEKQVSSWIKRTFQTEEPQNIKIDFEQFNDKLGDTICTSISKFISKLK